MEPPPTNRDGVTLYSDDFEMVVFGGHANVVNENETIETYYQEAIHNIGEIAYQKLTDHWYVISYEENGSIAYEKLFFNKNEFHTFTITYPVSKQDKYGPITTYIANHFTSPLIQTNQ